MDMTAHAIRTPAIAAVVAVVVLAGCRREPGSAGPAEKAGAAVEKTGADMNTTK